MSYFPAYGAFGSVAIWPCFLDQFGHLVPELVLSLPVLSWCLCGLGWWFRVLVWLFSSVFGRLVTGYSAVGCSGFTEFCGCLFSSSGPGWAPVVWLKHFLLLVFGLRVLYFA